jgi:hypothetical protein
MSELKEKVWVIGEAIRTSFRRLRLETDYGRWGDCRSFSTDWDARTARLARMIPPGSQVLEFGAGRMALKNYLPPGCSYTPSDLVDRGAGTIVCDLNGPELPAFPPHDVAVFSGVLEYIHDVRSVVSHIGGLVATIVASYAIRERVSGRMTRRAQGWVNDLTSQQFEEVFARAGFRHDLVEDWGNHKLYRFVRVAHAG